MGRITDTLNRITRDGEDGIIQLYELFHSINDYEIPIVRFTIFPGSSLIRQRINKKGTVFTRVSELSYPPPSVPAQGAGFNVAIKPEVTDKKIQFSNASICHFVKRGENMTVFTISDAIVDEFGSIDYKDRVLSKSEVAFYREKSQGLPFVN